MQISLILKGMAMGMAEVIPGVSGGTIAFITGIYARLIRAIGNILGPTVIGTLRREGFKAAWKVADGLFIAQLGIGMLFGIGIGVLAITALLARYPPVVWAFFFGLIVSSALYVARQIDRRTLLMLVLFLVGAAVAFGLTTINPLGGSEQLLYVFLAGSIAISALILPGISGSFILLLLGMYTVVLGAARDVTTFASGPILILLVFMLGCLVGLALFSRVLSYTFRRFPDETLATLTGFMIGSLNKLWPWRHALTYRTNSSGEQVPLAEETVLPSTYHELTGEPAFLVAAILAALFGFALVFVLDRFAPGGKDEMDRLQEAVE